MIRRLGSVLKVGLLLVVVAVGFDLWLGRTTYAAELKVLEISEVRERANGSSFAVEFERRGRFQSLSRLWSWPRTEHHAEEFPMVTLGNFQPGRQMGVVDAARLRASLASRRQSWLDEAARALQQSLPASPDAAAPGTGDAEPPAR